MTVRRLILPFLLLGCLSLSGAQAHDGTVNITGKITDNTCTVSPDSQKMTVQMGNVSSGQFAHPGEGGNYVPFSINLEKCGGAASRVSVTFTGDGDSSDSSLLTLLSGTGYATGMGIGIYDNQQQLVPLNTAGEETGLTPYQASVTLNFYARYVANGAAVASGIANATTTFVLTYA